MCTYLYKYIHVHTTPMNIFERLNRFNFEIHEVGYQERLTVDGDIVFYLKK
jgi:hypothetical protein